jgi:hypothetical protein
MLEVIPGIDDDRQIFGREDLGESVGEFRATDSTCESDNSHSLTQSEYFQFCEDINRQRIDKMESDKERAAFILSL